MLSMSIQTVCLIYRQQYDYLICTNTKRTSIWMFFFGSTELFRCRIFLAKFYNKLQKEEAKLCLPSSLMK